MYCGLQAAVDRLPRLAGVVGAEDAGGRDGDEDALGVARIQKDRVQAHAAGARLTTRPRAVAAQSGEFLPGLAAVRRAEQGGVFNAGIDGIRIGQRRFEMPDALELPGVLRAVVPLVSAGDALVRELVAHRLPGLAAVVRALDHLPEPAAGLRGVQPVRVNGRALEVINLPARKVRAADRPLLALAVRCQDERALPRANQHSYFAHLFFLSAPEEAKPNLAAGVDSKLAFGLGQCKRLGEWDRPVLCCTRPEGTAESVECGARAFRPALGRPFGTWGHLDAKPSVETLGYSRLSLRDRGCRVNAAFRCEVGTPPSGGRFAWVNRTDSLECPFGTTTADRGKAISQRQCH